MWASKDKQNQEVNDVVKAILKVLPLIDALLTERLKGTTAVTSSLIGALFSEIQSTLKVDFVEAASKLDTIKTAAET